MNNKDLGRVPTAPGASSLRSPEPVPVSAHSGDAPSRKCDRCGGTGTVHGIIDDDLFITGSWPCERGCRR